MKLKLIMCAMLMSNIVSAATYVIPVDGNRYFIGNDVVTCGTIARKEVSQVNCSAEPSGGLPYSGSGYNRREALNNLRKYCVSKQQSMDPNYCEQMADMATCN
jgi:hypothetical protein